MSEDNQCTQEDNPCRQAKMPDIDLGDLVPPTIDNITSICETNPGSFTKMMTAIEQHLNAQHLAGRISGDNYRTVYLGSLNSALQQAVQFEVEGAKLANEVAARKATLEMEVAKLAIEFDKLCMEWEKHKLQKELLEVQKELQKNQAKAFKYNHLFKMVKLLFDTITVANTQEIMDIFQGKNEIFGGINPKETWNEVYEWEKEIGKP